MKSDVDEPESKRQRGAGGNDEANESNDIWLPLSNVKRVVKAALAEAGGGSSAKVDQDAYRECAVYFLWLFSFADEKPGWDRKGALVRAATVFVSYITACAQEFTKASKRR